MEKKNKIILAIIGSILLIGICGLIGYLTGSYSIKREYHKVNVKNEEIVEEFADYFDSIYNKAHFTPEFGRYLFLLGTSDNTYVIYDKFAAWAFEDEYETEEEKEVAESVRTYLIEDYQNAEPADKIQKITKDVAAIVSAIDKMPENKRIDIFGK